MPITLLLPNNIKAAPHHTPQDRDRMSRISAIDFILSWFASRIAPRRGALPLKRVESIADRVLIIKSGTGSGKSTTIAPELYRAFNGVINKRIAVTQPRILTAMAIPAIIAKIPAYHMLKMGETIGYQTGPYERKIAKGVVFMTAGLLAQQLKTLGDDQICSTYGFIVIDECHDRSIEIDMLLMLVKGFMIRNALNPDCPFLILTSATFDTAKYANFMQLDERNVIEVGGFNYEISRFFQPETPTNYIKAAAELIIAIHTGTAMLEQTYDPGQIRPPIAARRAGDAPPPPPAIGGAADYATLFRDILVFVSGAADAGAIRELVDAANPDMPDDNHFISITLTRGTFLVANAEYQNIFKPIHSIAIVLGAERKVFIPRRRIIFTTNLAETGVTIDTAKHVVDTGFHKSMEIDPITGAEGLFSAPISEAAALQRKGRVGRLATGNWFPLYTAATFAAMKSDKPPSIYSGDITGMMLGIATRMAYPKWDGTIAPDCPAGPAGIAPSGTIDPYTLDMLDPPSLDSVAAAIEELFVLGLVDDRMVPTISGLIAAKASEVEIRSMCVILAGYVYGANVADLITLAAFLTVGTLDYTDRHAKTPYTYANIFAGADEEQLMYYDRFFVADDFIKCIMIWNDFMLQVRRFAAAAPPERSKKGRPPAAKKMGRDAAPSGPGGPFAPIAQWCKKNGLKYSGLLLIAAKRDEIIAMFVMRIGMNPFYNGAGIPTADYNLAGIIKSDIHAGIAEIRKLKRCIYEGYKHNSATWNDKAKQYILDRSHTLVRVKSDAIKSIPKHDAFKQLHPKKIIVNRATMVEDKATGVYVAESTMAASIDSFIRVDHTFIDS